MRVRQPITQYPTEIRFEIFGTAVAKGRPQVFHGHGVTPAKTRKWESSIEGQSLAFRPPYPYAGPVAIGILFHMKIPKSWSKKKKQRAADGILRPFGKRNDLDNMIKSILDPLNEIYFEDDGQVVEFIECDDLPTGKYYTTDTPRVTILVRYLPE